MATLVDITGDVAIDVDTRRAYPLFITAPPEDEGDTCGLYFAGEEGADGYVEQISYGPYVATAIILGEGDWSNGAVNLTEGTTVAEAIRLLNEAIDNIDGGGAQDGFALPLGDIAADGDGSWSPGAVPLTDDTPVSEAVDRINEVLGKLVPSQPPAFPGGALSVANSAGSSPRLASGVTANVSGSGLNPGDAVTRIATATVNSNIFNDVGPGDTGTLTLRVNDADVSSRVLTGTGDNGNYSGLYIADQKDYPVSTPGFWKSIDAGISGASAALGINSMALAHTGAGTTNTVFFVRDGMTSNPAVSNGAVSEHTAGTYAYSSSVPHYGTGGRLYVSASVSNLSGETYYGGVDPFVISGTNSIFSAVTVTFAGMGISTPIARQTTAATPMAAPVVVDINGTNIHNAGVVQGTSKNVNGSSSATSLATTNILVKRGSAGARIDENSVTVTGLGAGSNAVRVSTGTGDKPVASPSTWDSSAALAAHEAAVVGGVLRHDRTNYSTGYLPVGPDLSSGRDDPQYATFSFKRSALSAFKIAVTGTYAGVFIKLPGVSTAQPNGDGWWDATKPYDGAGIPGEVGDTIAGCALGTPMSGTSGTFQITFGTGSSTNATDNEILVRVKLTTGQAISSLTFSN